MKCYALYTKKATHGGCSPVLPVSALLQESVGF